MALRLLVQDDVVYEGDSIPIPRVGEHLRVDEQEFPIESVSWDLRDAATVVVRLVVGSKPYTY